MTSSFLDRVLARLDGAVACIWTTGVLELHSPIDRDRLRDALDHLDLPRLHQRWTGRTWAGHHPAYTLRDLPSGSAAEAMDALINDPIDLRIDPALRVTLFGTHRMAVQLHHAAGDGRSFIQLHQRLGALYAGQSIPKGEGHQFGRLPAAKALAMGLLRLPTQLRPEHRMLARRGHSLHHRGGPAGRVMHLTLRVDPGAHDPTGLFFATVAAAAARWDPDGTLPIRLRVPVDLRRPLGLNAVSMENVSSAIPVEITRSEADSGAALIPLLPLRIRELAERGVPLANLVTLFLGDRFLSEAGLRAHIRPEMLENPRANTLVTTYVGSLDKALAGFPVRQVAGHTPTWGVMGYRFDGQLCLFFSGFEGIWSRGDLADFADLAAEWLTELGLTVDREV